MISISATAEWHAAHPGGVIGLLEVSGVDNSLPSSVLDPQKRAAEARLRELYRGYSRQDFLALPVMAAYEAYYKRFEKTYHVQLQLESIVLKNKNLPNVSPLVDANFIAELETLILTAGHDVAKLQGQVIIDVSKEGDEITQMNGQTKPMRTGDMIMRDAGGVSCSIIYGQDNRSAISQATNTALYVAYVPPNVPEEAVEAQLSGIERHVKLFAPQARVEQRTLIRANG